MPGHQNITIHRKAKNYLAVLRNISEIIIYLEVTKSWEESLAAKSLYGPSKRAKSKMKYMKTSAAKTPYLASG